MIYPDSYWPSAYLLPFVGMSTPLWFGAWDSYLMAIKISNFKCYLHCARLENLFKNRIFVISVKNCTLQLNFKTQLLLIKIHLINTKSQIQPTWHHLLPEKFSKSETFNNYFRTVLAHFWNLTMQWCSLPLGAFPDIIGFQNSATLFLVLKIGNFNRIYLISDLVCDDHCLEKFPFRIHLSFFFVYKENLRSHKKKLNSVCTGLVFILALLAVPAPVGFPSTLFCHVAVKPTICDMLLNHEKLGTDTLLPTPPSESREYSWARQCTQASCAAFSVCLLNIPSPPTSLEKVLGIRWPSPNTDRHNHQKTRLPLLGPLLVHLATVSFENVLKNRCLLLYARHPQH